MMFKPLDLLLFLITRHYHLIMAKRNSCNNRWRFISLVLIHFLYRRTSRLFKIQMPLMSIPDQVMFKKWSGSYVPIVYGENQAVVIGNVTNLLHKSTSLRCVKCYLCTVTSHKKYSIFYVHRSDCPRNTLIVSETSRFNIEHFFFNSFPDEGVKYFLVNDLEEMTIEKRSKLLASEVKVSLISNPYDLTEELIGVLLNNYFTQKRVLRKNDIFYIPIKDYAPQFYYSTANPRANKIYFITKSVKCANGSLSDDVCLISKENTTLIQEGNVHGYLPRQYCDFYEFTEGNDRDHKITFGDVENCIYSNCPPPLEEMLETLISFVKPFMQKDIRVPIMPTLLLKGPIGTGKTKLIEITSRRLGFHLLSVDFSEIQTLTAAQTEAKLRIVLNNAAKSIPCILHLNNIQIFGKDSEGRNDARLFSSFTNELKKLYDRRLGFPIITMATADDSEIPIELQRIFLEVINMKTFDRHQRTMLLSWLIKSRGYKETSIIDLSKIAGICTDFVIEDLQSLVSHAIKTRCEKHVRAMDQFRLPQLNHNRIRNELSDEDFIEAFEYLQTLYSDRMGAAQIPKVHWEDIGGLADLKNEILRRIQLSKLDSVTFGRSGLLLYGPPGTGKTLLAKAVATECQMNFLSVKGPELINMYVGQSEKNVRAVFERARAASPCIIFFDELDSLAPNRGQNGDSAGVMDRVVSQLLAEMDGLESTGNIIMIGATNRPDLIDPALLRPGRFDKMLYVGIYSDSESQLSVLKALTRKFQFLENGKELERLIEVLPQNLTGADLYAICSNAWLLSVRRSIEKLNTDIIVEYRDLSEAAKKMTPSVSLEELRKFEKLRLELSSG